MTRFLFLALAALAASLTAQDTKAPEAGPPRLEQPLARISADGVQQLLAQWPKTRIGRLLADPDCVEAATLVRDFTANQLRRQRAAYAFAHEHANDLELEPWLVATLLRSGQDDIWCLLRQPPSQVKQAQMLVAMPPGATMRQQPVFATFLSCTPRWEGRWTQAFEAEAEAFRKSSLLKEISDSKVDGFPAYAFSARVDTDGSTYLDNRSNGRWHVHLPGTFVYGTGVLDPRVKLKEAMHERPAGIGLEMDLSLYAGMFEQTGVGPPQEFQVLGFDKLRRLEWSGRFVGERILDEFAVELDGEPGGLVAALLTGSGKLPAQALPKRALAQVRAAINLDKLNEILPVMLDELGLEQKEADKFLAAFDGGMALGCCAPGGGGLIPRIYASLGIASTDAFDELVAKYLTNNDDLPTKKVRYGDVECTILKIPGAPQGIQPAFCRVGNTLHVAESGRSLRALLKAQQDGVVAMDVGDAPLPAGKGDPTGSLELRCDEAELYEAFYERWLPLFEMSGASDMLPAITRDDMPEPETVAKYCGKSQGLLRKDGNTYRLQHLGALGGPEAAAFLMTWGPMICANMTDYSVEQIWYQIARHKLQAVSAALLKFEQREKRWPKDLAELFAGSKLPDDALLMPADELAEPFQLADGRKLKSSFRYFPKPVRFRSANGGDGNMLLVEIQPHRYNRATLNVKGEVLESYGNENTKPIDSFRPR